MQEKKIKNLQPASFSKMKQNALVYTWYNITQPSMHVPSETFISHDNW